MLREIARPLALILCMVSLLAAFHAAFFESATGLGQRALDAVACLALAGSVCLMSALVFRDGSRDGSNVSRAPQVRLRSTLPLRLFYWGSGVMVVLFLLAWYLEATSVFDGHVRY